MKLVKLPSGGVLNMDSICGIGKHGLDGSLAITFIGSQVVIQGQDAAALRVYLDEACDLASPTPRAESSAEVVGGGN